MIEGVAQLVWMRHVTIFSFIRCLFIDELSCAQGCGRLFFQTDVAVKKQETISAFVSFSISSSYPSMGHIFADKIVEGFGVLKNDIVWSFFWFGTCCITLKHVSQRSVFQAKPN